ncbi:MAG: HTTM domain-containing protein [Planctomycetota bacterium]
MLRTWATRLHAPVDNASLVFFRLAFGLLMLWNTARYIMVGRVEKYYVEPTFHFKYFGFEWVEPLPTAWLHGLFGIMAVLCVFITFGLFYRISMALFCLTFTYAFLLEQARYLNHYYLLCLVSLLMVFVPAHRAVSVDVLLWPHLRCRHAPAWSVWLPRAQLGIVYFYGGIAKLNHDWLRGEPMSTWLADRSETVPVVGSLFTEPWVGYGFSYGGLLFDLLVVPLLLWPRTRRYAFVAAVLFHVTNAKLFHIGVFPWMMIATTTIFFKPSWPRRFLGLEPVSAITARAHDRKPAWLVVLALYLLLQVLLPLRHFLYPGVVSWTEEGHTFAWHMKLRDKESRLMLVARDPASENVKVWQIDPKRELTDWQYEKMAGRPDMILQYAHHIARRLRAQTGHDIEVRAQCEASLNGRPFQVLIDPNVDLAKEPRSLRPATWIVPLDQR